MGVGLTEEAAMPIRLRPRGTPTHLAVWLGLSVAVLAADYLIGPMIQFPALFVIPVSLAAWYNGAGWGLLLAVLLPLGRLYLVTIADAPWSFYESAVNAAIRIGVLSAFAWLVDRSARQSAALARRVGLLEGLHPMCAVCGKVRTADGGWEPLEHYVRSREKDRLAPEVCPTCAGMHGESTTRR
jgi:hypothetical protein